MFEGNFSCALVSLLNHWALAVSFVGIVMANTENFSMTAHASSASAIHKDEVISLDDFFPSDNKPFHSSDVPREHSAEEAKLQPVMKVVEEKDDLFNTSEFGHLERGGNSSSFHV